MHKHLMIMALLAFVVAACVPQVDSENRAAQLVAAAPDTAGEFARQDAVASGETSVAMTVFGVSLGMSEDDVLAILGPADEQTEFNFGAVKNWEYGKALGLNTTGLVVHFERGAVTRIAIGSALDQYLRGASVVAKTKDEIYGVFGIPDRQYDLPRSQRLFIYNDRGVEVYLEKGIAFQYALVYPNRLLPTTSYEPPVRNQAEALKIVLPRLLSDTTTLCMTGPTFGLDLAAGTCEPFPDACSVPDHFVVVSDCENQTRLNWFY